MWTKKNISFELLVVCAYLPFHGQNRVPTIVNKIYCPRSLWYWTTLWIVMMVFVLTNFAHQVIWRSTQRWGQSIKSSTHLTSAEIIRMRTVSKIQSTFICFSNLPSSRIANIYPAVANLYLIDIIVTGAVSGFEEDLR